MSDLQQQIRQRTKFRTEDELLRLMGYAKPPSTTLSMATAHCESPSTAVGNSSPNVICTRRPNTRPTSRSSSSKPAFVAVTDPACRCLP